MAALPFGVGPMELGLVALVVLLLFGPKRLPQLGKSIGKTVKAIRDGVDGKDEDADDTSVKSSASTTKKDADDDE
ncbi:MAG: twin-arginine translocase TatA/TatE family subunit [Actinobacteria bacterium HGW-Actinobacteria-10]|nr:MAG: twin-arginine translocase TatA/TatE family subunit [Actinobacteria bacterium HGW-Actinobacteria-10]